MSLRQFQRLVKKMLPDMELTMEIKEEMQAEEITSLDEEVQPEDQYPQTPAKDFEAVSIEDVNAGWER